MFQPVPRPAERLSDQLAVRLATGDAPGRRILLHRQASADSGVRGPQVETDEREEEKMEAIDVGRIKNKKRKKKQKKKA